jgi:hypothetical protein
VSAAARRGRCGYLRGGDLPMDVVTIVAGGGRCGRGRPRTCQAVRCPPGPVRARMGHPHALAGPETPEEFIRNWHGFPSLHALRTDSKVAIIPFDAHGRRIGEVHRQLFEGQLPKNFPLTRAESVNHPQDGGLPGTVAPGQDGWFMSVHAEVDPSIAEEPTDDHPCEHVVSCIFSQAASLRS